MSNGWGPLRPNAPYRCMWCGLPSWVDPSDQRRNGPPPTYCWETDHGGPEEEDHVDL